MNRRSFLSMIILAPVAAMVGAPVVCAGIDVQTSGAVSSDVLIWNGANWAPCAEFAKPFATLRMKDLLDATDELESLLPSLPQEVSSFIVRRLADGSDLAPDISVQSETFTASGTGERFAFLEPSEPLLELIAAARAGKLDLGLAKKILGHDFHSVGRLESSNEDRSPAGLQGPIGERPQPRIRSDGSAA